MYPCNASNRLLFAVDYTYRHNHHWHDLSQLLPHFVLQQKGHLAISHWRF